MKLFVVTKGRYEGAMLRFCPDCGLDVERHEMFDPPMCPVVRINWSIPIEERFSWDRAEYDRVKSLLGKPEASEPPRSTNETRSADGEGAQETR